MLLKSARSLSIFDCRPDVDLVVSKSKHLYPKTRLSVGGNMEPKWGYGSIKRNAVVPVFTCGHGQVLDVTRQSYLRALEGHGSFEI